MADKIQAATATANAPASESATGAAGALSSPPPTLAPELSALPSFDVEDFLAGQSDGAESKTETTQDAETAEEDTTPATEEEEEALAPESESEEADGDEAEADAQAEDDEESPEGLKPKAIKRFNKLLAQRNEAKEEARLAKAELQALKAKQEQHQDEPQPLKVEGNPLAAVTNEEQLEAHENYYQRWKAWCRRNPNGGIPPADLMQGDQELEPDTVVSYLEAAENMLEKVVPKHRDFLQNFRSKRTEAKASYPKMFQPGTPEHETFQALKPRLLNFATQADQDALLAKLVKAELMEREERDGVARYTRVELKKPATSAKAAAKPAPKPATTGTAVPPVKATNGRSARELAWEKANAPHGSVDVEDLMDD